MADSFAHVRRNVFWVGDARSSPSVGVAVVHGAKVSVVGERREVGGGVADITVEWAGVEFGGGGESVMYGSHEGGGESPVVA